MSREQIVRDTAYAIWEAEGKPQGRDREHWQQAEARVDASLTKGKAKATTPAKGSVPASAAKAGPAAKPPAKAAATKPAATKSESPKAVAPKKPKKTG